MANVNAPSGFRPVKHLSGGDIHQHEYSIGNAYNTNIFTGDPVKLQGAGKNVQLAGTDDVPIGVFNGCRYVDSQGKQVFSRYWPASTAATDIVAYVFDDPQILFEIQADSVLAANVGNLCDWDAGTGDTATGTSGAYALVSGNSETSGKPLRVYEVSDTVGNGLGAYGKIHVLFAEHALARVVSGVGGV